MSRPEPPVTPTAWLWLAFVAVCIDEESIPAALECTRQSGKRKWR